MCAREFAAWADKVDSLKRAGKFAEAVRLCRKHYPFPYAFTNAAIAIRRQISEHRKEKSDWTHLLEQLYHNAVCEDFFSSIKWADVIDNNLASSTARDRELGRQELAIWLAWWRDVLLVKEKVPDFTTHISRMETLKVVADALSSTQVVRAINAVRETMEHLERNVNLRLALEDMMLALPRLQEGVR